MDSCEVPGEAAGTDTAAPRQENGLMLRAESNSEMQPEINDALHWNKCRSYFQGFDQLHGANLDN
jgi:hypothetical protein